MTTTEFKDLFSRHASEYARYRPTYPPELFEYLASVAPARDRAWDHGTGNGQAAVGLARHFREVVATDPSEEQIQNAFPHERVTYRVALTETAGIEPRSCDLVTVAQALHWFDIPKFYEVAKGVLKLRGVLAVWCYSLCRAKPEVDRIVDSFYYDTVGPYWPAERKYVDDGYRSLPFPFDEFQPPPFQIELRWSLHDLLSYLRTWSPTKIYIRQNGTDPVDEIVPLLARAWGDPDEAKPVRWPIHMRIGRRTTEAGSR